MEDMAPSIENHKMSFVNRKSALDQLMKVHIANLNRAVYGSGAEWTVPICDNIFGLGKSELALQYVKRCNEIISLKNSSSDLQLTFKNSMSMAHTAHVIFSPGDMEDENKFEMVLVEKLQEILIPLFEVAPACLFE